jgi:hypothetical protein
VGLEYAFIPTGTEHSKVNYLRHTIESACGASHLEELS